jgi:hypothetical protein
LAAVQTPSFGAAIQPSMDRHVRDESSVPEKRKLKGSQFEERSPNDAWYKRMPMFLTFIQHILT